jgi:hypothetical protein
MTYNHIDIRDALQNPELSPVVIMALLEDLFGEDFYFWDISTIEMELRDEVGAEVPTEVLNKIGALQVVITSNAVFNQIDAFSGVCNTFASGEPSFSVFDPVTSEEAVNIILQLSMLRDILPFGRVVKEYVGLIMKEDPDALLDYMVGTIKPDKENIFNLIKDKLSNPQTPIDEYIAEELMEMVAQAEQFPGLINKVIPTDLI